MFIPPILEGVTTTMFLPILQGMEADNEINNIFKAVFSWADVDYSILNLLYSVFIFTCLSSAFLITYTLLVAKTLETLTVNLRDKIIHGVFRLKYEKFNFYEYGYINNAVVREVPSVVFSFSMISNLLASFFYALIYTAIPFMINPGLVLLLFVVGLLLLPVFKKINTITKNLSVKSSKEHSNLQSLLSRVLSNYKYFKSTFANEKIEEHVYEKTSVLGTLRVKQAKLEAISKFGFEPVIVILIASILYYFVVIKGQEAIECAFLLFMLNRSIRTVLSMQQNLRKLYSSWGSINLVEAFFEELDENKEEISEEALKPDFDNDIRLENVSFSYNNNQTVLDDLNLTIKKNTTVAFVGQSGSGKSTLCNLVINLLNPTSGNISLGCTDYNKLEKEAFRKKVGYVTQESVVFNGTITENITLWGSKGEESSANLSLVAKMADFDGFVDSQKDGFNSLVGEDGVNMSGGQRQRLCIARELFKQPALFVFDEATSALDSKTEKNIQSNLDSMKGERTIIIIAHRLSTIRNVDKIYVLNEGRIVEEGDYKSLVEKGGVFSSMIKVQNN
ncbi:MAG: ABC transporter ATP-binding protein/permease [Lentisphaeraceae bacterium]|nr:ABC transporter ATP-binding protein/permease [Lentisphaeraceae bacterium]